MSTIDVYVYLFFVDIRWKVSREDSSGNEEDVVDHTVFEDVQEDAHDEEAKSAYIEAFP